MYLRPVQSEISVFSTKILAGTYTLDLDSRNDLFPHPKYEVRHIFRTCTIAGTYFLTLNVRRKMYLRPSRLWLPVFSPKI